MIECHEGKQKDWCNPIQYILFIISEKANFKNRIRFDGFNETTYSQKKDTPIALCLKKKFFYSPGAQSWQNLL